MLSFSVWTDDWYYIGTFPSQVSWTPYPCWCGLGAGFLAPALAIHPSSSSQHISNIFFFFTNFHTLIDNYHSVHFIHFCTCMVLSQLNLSQLNLSLTNCNKSLSFSSSFQTSVTFILIYWLFAMPLIGLFLVMLFRVLSF